MAIKLHGKDYIEVKDRVAAAHAEESYSMLKEETFSMGGREYVRVFIDVKGKQYIGTAECKYNANPKTPDGQSPFECGETSALGRALGFAGYGVVDSIASADEVVSNEQQTSAANGHHDLPSIKALQACCALLCGRGQWQSMIHKALKIEDDELALQEDDLTPDDREKIATYLDYVEQAKAKKASAGAGK
jgi:hypothetical protein